MNRRRRSSPKRLGFTLLALLTAAAATSRPAPAVAGAAITLPDLKILVPADRISIGIDPGSGDRQLRFTHITADVGRGPFEIDPAYDQNAGTSTFRQVIYNSPRVGFEHRRRLLEPVHQPAHRASSLRRRGGRSCTDNRPVEPRRG